MLRIWMLVFFPFCFLQTMVAQQELPVDKQATKETKNLYTNLKDLAKQGVMFGHQDDLAYGMGWKYEPGRSDVKEVVGEYPAVFGWDLGHLELDSPVNLDSVPFDKMKAFVQQVYKQGGVNTFSWHFNNPVDPTKTSWDKLDSTAYKIMNDPQVKARYVSWLDKFADFTKSLKGPEGEAIPVIFRPLHEHNGSWFWWGRDFSTPEEYINLWRFTADYLRNQKGVHNLLYAYSPDKFYSKEEFLERYPGDEYVDLIGFDVYHRPNPADSLDPFVENTRKMVNMLKEIGQEKNKLYAMTEGGLEQIPMENWWTETLYPIIKDSGLSYVLVWRNGRPDHYYAPFPGQVSAKDFKKLTQKEDILLQKEVAEKNIYSSKGKKKRK